MSDIFIHLRRAAAQALANDVFNTAKAAAYSGMLMLFPALLATTAVLARSPEGPTLVGTARGAFEQVLPADSMDLLQSYGLSQRVHSHQVMLSAAGFSVFAALGHDAFAHGGFRRAYCLPMDDWSFWGRRLRAL